MSDQSSFQKGLVFAQEEKWGDAVSSFNDAIRQDTEDAGAWNNRGVAYAQQGSYSRAIHSFSYAIRLVPEDANVWNNRGLSYEQNGDYDQAVSDYEEANRINPDLPSSQRNLAFRQKHNSVGNEEAGREGQKEELGNHYKLITRPIADSECKESQGSEFRRMMAVMAKKESALQLDNPLGLSFERYSVSVFEWWGIFIRTGTVWGGGETAEGIGEVWWEAKFGNLGRMAGTIILLPFSIISYIMMKKAQRRVRRPSSTQKQRNAAKSLGDLSWRVGAPWSRSYQGFLGAVIILAFIFFGVVQWTGWFSEKSGVERTPPAGSRDQGGVGINPIDGQSHIEGKTQPVSPRPFIVELPITNNSIRGRVKVNAIEADFVIDTGATDTAISYALARRLWLHNSLPEAKRVRVKGVSGSLSLPVVRLHFIGLQPTVGFSAHALRPMDDVLVFPEDGNKVNILGMDYLKHFDTSIDKNRQVFRFESR